MHDLLLIVGTGLVVCGICLLIPTAQSAWGIAVSLPGTLAGWVSAAWAKITAPRALVVHAAPPAPAGPALSPDAEAALLLLRASLVADSYSGYASAWRLIQKFAPQKPVAESTAPATAEKGA